MLSHSSMPSMMLSTGTAEDRMVTAVMGATVMGMDTTMGTAVIAKDTAMMDPPEKGRVIKIYVEYIFQIPLHFLGQEV